MSVVRDFADMVLWVFQRRQIVLRLRSPDRPRAGRRYVLHIDRWSSWASQTKCERDGSGGCVIPGGVVKFCRRGGQRGASISLSLPGRFPVGLTVSQTVVKRQGR